MDINGYSCLKTNLRASLLGWGGEGGEVAVVVAGVGSDFAGDEGRRRQGAVGTVEFDLGDYEAVEGVEKLVHFP